MFNDKIQEYLQLSKCLFGMSADAYSVSPRLLFIYFGLCFIAGASVLFNWFCPTQIKRYSTPEEYIAGDETYLSEHGRGLIEHYLKTGDKKSREMFAKLRTYYEHKPSPDGITEFRYQADNLFRNEMHLYYDQLNRSHVLARWTITTFYSIGLLALAVPSLQVFSRVSVVMFEISWKALSHLTVFFHN